MIGITQLVPEQNESWDAAFATPPCLTTQWQRYVDSNFSVEEREKIAKELGDQYDTDDEEDD